MLFFEPDFVGIFDAGGIPIFAIPDQEKLTLIGNVSTVLQSLLGSDKDLTIIETSQNTVFYLAIDNKGYMVVGFKKTPNSRHLEWIVLFLANDIRSAIAELIEGFVTSEDIERINHIYKKTISNLRKLAEIVTSFDETLRKASKVLGKKIFDAIESTPLLNISENAVELNSDYIKRTRITSSEYLEELEDYVKKQKSKIRNILSGLVF